MGIPHIQSFAFPKIDISTTSTTSFDVLNGLTGVTVTNTMPWAGTVKRILLGHSQDIGTGFIHLIHYPNGAFAGSFDGPTHNFVADPGPSIEIVDVNETFTKDTGIYIKFLGDAVTSCALRVTMEVEFDFV
jgi:hypothetical protein